MVVVEAAVVLQGITKRYGSVTATDNLSLSVNKGEFLSLLGPSGCGKTTILRMIAGFSLPDSGRIFIQGRDVTDEPPNGRDTAMVFQNYALFPHMTVFDNVAFGLRMRGVANHEIGPRVTEALRLVRLEGMGDRYPRQLSGGQQQRVALARAIVVNPAVLLLDEPLSNLDAKLRQEMRVELRQLHGRLGLTTIFVTHDQEEALTLSDRIVVMNAGRIEQVGTPREVFERPRTRFVADFLGVRNILAGRYEDGVFVTAGGLRLVCPRSEHRGELSIGLRPNRIVLNPPEGSEYTNRISATVELVSYRGNVVEVVVHLPTAERLFTEVPTTVATASDLRPGTKVVVGWRPDDVLLLEA